MNVKYTELLNVGVKQPFYENGICPRYTTTPLPDLVFIPAAETLVSLKRLDFIFKNTDNTGGFTILAATNGKVGPNYLLRFLPKKGEKLTFFVVMRNPDMLNFNELPTATDPENLFYFTNQISGDPALRNNLHLSKTAAGVSGMNDLFKVSKSLYRHHHGVAVAPGSAKVRHLLTGAEVMAVLIQNTLTGSDLTFNLSALPPGKCELSISAVPMETFYHTGDDVPASTIGVIELSLSDALDANYRVVETDHSIRPDIPLYYIPFINRVTTWRYTFKLAPNGPLYTEISKLTPAEKTDFMSRLKLTSNDASLTFSKTSPDDKTVIFESIAPFALKEKYTEPVSKDPLKLVLTKYVGLPMKEAAVKENLPYPFAGMIDARNPSLIYSDIFLTL